MEVLFATASRGGKMRQRNEMNVLNAGLYSTSGEFLYMSDSNQKLVANQIGGSLGKYKNNKYSSSGGGGGGGGGGNDGTNEQIGTLKFPKLVKQALKTTGAKSRLVKDLPSLNELSRKPESFANMVDSGNTTSNNKSDKKKKKAKSRKPGGGGGGVAGKKKKRSPKVGDKSPSGNLIDALNNLEIGNQRSLLTTTTTLTNEINLSSNQNESDPTVENNELHQWPPKPNDSLRWEYELTDEQAEQARLEIYKQNRRKRYVEHRARMCRVKFDLYEDEDEDDDELDNEEDDLDVESSSLGPGSRLAKNTSRLFRKKKSTSEVFTTTSNLNEKTRPTGMNNRGNDDSAISSLSSSNSPFL